MEGKALSLNLREEEGEGLVAVKQNIVNCRLIFPYYATLYNIHRCINPFQPFVHQVLNKLNLVFIHFHAEIMAATNLAPNFDLEDFLVRKSTHIYQMSIRT